MKKLYIALILLIHSVAFSFAITDEYDSAVHNAKAFKKPLLLVFVGSDWSHESRKLLTKLQDVDSQDVIKNDIILCKIDFPELNRQNEKQLQANKELKEKFNITQIPSAVLLDDEQNYVTTFGFVQVPPSAFARHIKETYSVYFALKQAAKTLGSKTVAELEKLLADAKALQNQALWETVVTEGMSRVENGVFALEKYSHLVAVGKEKCEEAQSLKRVISGMKEKLSIDARLQSAMMAFEAAKKEGDVTAALSPLEQVLKDVPKDHAQLWRVHFLVAKYLQDMHQAEKAAEYAQEAKKNAPEAFHKQLDAIISEK